jgi:hypothetical protein
MENTPVNLLDEFASENLPSIRRRKLLSVWIRIFLQRPAVILFTSRHFVFKLELVALVPYLYVMLRLRKRWEAAANP